jgi:ABC-type transporter Mla MlaB component
VRRSGVLDSVKGLGLHDHACLPFGDWEQLREAVVTFLADGRRLGQRLIYVGACSEEELRSDLAALPGRDRLIADGTLQLRSLPEIYTPGEPIDPEAQLAVYADATEQALKEGYSGLRVGAEVTALVASPETWEAHTRWEAFADRYMASMPMAALCCYDTREVPHDVMSDLACVHPGSVDSPELAPFHLCATGEKSSLMLHGEVDYFCADDLDRLLALATPAEGKTVLDLSAVRFVDHHAVLRLADRTRDPDRRVEVINVPAQARRLSDLLAVGL